MKILAFDTSTEACVVGVLADGEIIEHFSIPEQKHTKILLPIIEEILQRASVKLTELDAIAFGRGPGAFTGVRLAVSVAQGLGYSLNIPVVSVSSLAVVAQRVFEQYQHNSVLVAIDARMDEVYFGAFRLGSSQLMVPVEDEKVLAIDQVQMPEGDDWIAVGTGWIVYRENVSADLIDNIAGDANDVFPRASSLISLAEGELRSNKGIIAGEAVPVYLRNNVVNQPQGRK